MQHRVGQVRKAGKIMIGKVAANSQNTNTGPPKFDALRPTEPQPMQHTFVLRRHNIQFWR
jgi:hypothetical protein